MLWNSDDTFGFAGAAAGSTGTASTPAGTARAPLAPPANAARALIDPRGSAIFWVAAFAVLGLAMVSGQLKVSAAVNGRAGKK